MPILTTEGDQFLRDREPHQIISGAIHYFRVHPDLWEDRLLRLKALGLNTIETYVAWNFHERRRGETRFDGWRDLPRFVELAGAVGLDVILRPGPYICAEWDFGGFPAWLMADPTARLRCMDPAYLDALDHWFDELIPLVVPQLSTNGGPICAVQVENEYGSYGSDQEYLAHVRDGLIRRGVDTLLVTSDGPGPDYLRSGMTPGAVATVNFGSAPDEAFAELRAFQPEGPEMCMEYWNGWFDHWGEEHHLRDVADAAQTLDAMLSRGASVNFYMGHGGTNFGLWNGANFEAGTLQPTVTSYDYDAPVGEAGETAEKFHAYREVIARYRPLPADPPPALPSRLSARTASDLRWCTLWDAVPLFDSPVRAPNPSTMEDLGQDHGLVLYRGRTTVPEGGGDLVLDGLADRATVLADGQPVGVVHRNDPAQQLRLPGGDQPVDLDVIVENEGRINYGNMLGERKGVRAIRLGERLIHGWQSIGIRLDDPDLVDRLPLAPGAPGQPGPVFAQGRLEIDAPADGFIDLAGWSHCFVWLNGFLLGRYRDCGPQRTLYAPAPLWRAGDNPITVLEMDAPGEAIRVTDRPILDNRGLKTD